MSDKMFLVLSGSISLFLYTVLFLRFQVNWNQIDQILEYLFVLFFSLMLGIIPTTITVVIVYELREAWLRTRNP